MSKIKTAMVIAMLVASPALAQPSQHTPATISDVKGLSPPGVDHTGIRASALHWGMAAAEATRIMGTPSDVNAYTRRGRQRSSLGLFGRADPHQSHYRQ